MQNGIHFISGLPRSGSTLLAAILRQNPRFHAGMTSPVGAMYMALEGAMSRRNEAAVFIGDAQRRDVLKGLFTNYYDAIQEEKLVFDTNRVADRIHRFNLRRRPHEIRIASRTAVPQELGLSPDRRRLGVSIERILLRGRNVTTAIEPGETSLAEGFHEAEPGHRWTDGNARLPRHFYEGLMDGFTVEIHAAALDCYPVAEAWHRDEQLGGEVIPFRPRASPVAA